MPEAVDTLVDRILREHKRYEGDGQSPAVTGALPVGDPSSGPWNPKKSHLRQALKAVLAAYFDQRGVETLADLEAITPETGTQPVGVVYDDPTVANNGYYIWNGTDWVKERGLPDTFARVTLGGTSNAQTGAVSSQVNPADIEVFIAFVTTDNTGPMTLSVGGETPRDVVNAAGNPLSAGEWTGVVLFVLNSDGDYQLIIDAGAAVAAAQSASEAAASAVAADEHADRAENAQQAAEDAASSVSPTEFPNISTAEALTPVSAPNFIRTAGYTTAGDGGGALYKKVASEPTHAGKFSITLADGVTVVWYELAEASPDLKMFGCFTSDDIADAMEAINAIAGEDSPLEVGVNDAYTLSREVHISKPILFTGKYAAETTTNTNGTPSLSPSIRWSGADGGRMITYARATAEDMIAGTTTGEQLIGGGFEGILFIGAVGNGNYAEHAIWAASTKEAVFDIAVRQFTGDALIVDGGNGILSQRNEITLNVVWGAGLGTTEEMTGVYFRRFNNQPSTQNTIHRAYGLIYNGDLVRFGDTDNNHLKIAHGVTQSGGTGRALACLNGVTQPARNNIISYLAGDAHFESDTYGNTIIWTTSEGQAVTKAAGAQYHILNLVDYVTAARFYTPGYALTASISVPVGQLIPDGTVASVQPTAGGLWTGVRFPDSAAGFVRGAIPRDERLGDGNITGMRFFFSTETANTSAEAAFRVRMETAGQLSGIATPDFDETFVVAVNDTVNVWNRRTIAFSTPLPISLDDGILYRIDRLPADASDTATGNIILFGIEFLYESEGPNSAGSGPYDLPSMRI